MNSFKFPSRSKPTGGQIWFIHNIYFLSCLSCSRERRWRWLRYKIILFDYQLPTSSLLLVKRSCFDGWSCTISLLLKLVGLQLIFNNRMEWVVFHFERVVTSSLAHDFWCLKIVLQLKFRVTIPLGDLIQCQQLHGRCVRLIGLLLRFEYGFTWLLVTIEIELLILWILLNRQERRFLGSTVLLLSLVKNLTIPLLVD
jgi:hypothetical protein